MPRTAPNSKHKSGNGGRRGNRSRRLRRPSGRSARTAGSGRTRPIHGSIPLCAGIPGTCPRAARSRWTARSARARNRAGRRRCTCSPPSRTFPAWSSPQDKVAKAGKANEISRFKPLLAPLPLAGTVVTTDAMQANRDNSLFLRKGKDAHYLWPVLGNQPGLNAQLNALDWENTPVAAATGEITRGRIETRTVRVLPAPEGTGFAGAAQAVLIERYVTYKKKGQWRTRAESVLYLTSLDEGDSTPEDLLAHVRGHWRVEHTHWLRDVIWKEDKSLIRTGNGPQVWSAIANLVITLFRIHGVTRFAKETRRCAQDPRRALQLLGIPCPSPG
ncbi:MAG TPA: ISAs1 family transposase [Streptosporangiaceae bacterium]|nr:ISAs1 family transposase [Streptosporangiaceae bacterium]